MQMEWKCDVILKEITSYIEMTQNKNDVSLKKFIGYHLNEK